MQIRVFPPHYQLVYISFDISSFSVISYDGRIVFSRAYNRPLTMVQVFYPDEKTEVQDFKFIDGIRLQHK